MEIESEIERQEIFYDAYKRFNVKKDICIDNYNNGSISLKERAEELTNYQIDFHKETNNQRYSFIKSHSEIFSLDEVYKKNPKEYLVIDLKIIINTTEQDAIERLIKDNKIEDYKLIKKDQWLIYQFLYSIKRNKVIEKIRLEYVKEKDISDFYNPEKSYHNSMNLTRFNFTIGLTPLKGILINCMLVAPFSKLDYAVYLAINNGCEIYPLGKIFNDDGKTQPKYYNDLKYVFRSSWEANIARILNYKSIEWEYEKEGFLLESNFLIEYYKYNTYIPDFFISNNKIIEVKGYWDIHSITQVSLFKQQYIDRKLFLIDKDMMYSLNRLYEKLLPNWKSTNINMTIYKLPVVGITRKERIDNVRSLKVGSEVNLNRDKNNDYDIYAIKVLSLEGELIGYIAKNWASIFSDKLDLGMTFTAIVSKIEPKVIILDVKRMNFEENIAYEFLLP